MIVQNAQLCGAPVIGIAADIIGSSLVVNSGHLARPGSLSVLVITKTRAQLCTHRDLVATDELGGARSGHYWWRGDRHVLQHSGYHRLLPCSCLTVGSTVAAPARCGVATRPGPSSQDSSSNIILATARLLYFDSEMVFMLKSG